MRAGAASGDRRTELVATMLDVVAADGLDRLSVREVAARAGVSIGTVQHHFSTKDEMLAAAFEEVVARTRRRVEALRFGDDLRANLGGVLRQLLPLDARRAAETRVHLAFAARAAVNPDLARIQRRTLDAVHTELAAALTAAGHTPDVAEVTARAVLAVADGLALHAVSAPGLLSRPQLMRLLDRALDALVGD